MEAALVAARFLNFATAMLLFGGGGFVLAARNIAGTARDKAEFLSLQRACAAGALLTAILWFFCVAASMAGEWRAATDPATLQAVLGTSFGHVWSWRIGLAIVAVVLSLLPYERVLVLTAALLLGTAALTGHAAMQTGSEGVLHRAADALHLLSGGYWIGALVALAMLWPAASRNADNAYGLLRRFSDLGVVAVALVVLTGATNALLTVHDWSAALSSLYGRVLLVKVALVAAMIGLALFNRLVFVPALRGAALSPPRGFRRTLWTEIAIGGFVILAASLLGTVAPPMPDGM